MLKQFVSVFIFLFIVGVAYSFADYTPMGIVQNTISRVVSILQDKSLVGTEHRAEKKAKVCIIVDETFDFAVMARGTLMKNWKQMTDEEKTEFVSTFRKLLQSVYFDKILDYSYDDISYKKEVIKRNKAYVFTQINNNGSPISVKYKLVNRSNQWKVYDIEAEGISLIANYRPQFQDIIKQKGINGLIQELHKKILELNGIDNNQYFFKMWWVFSLHFFI